MQSVQVVTDRVNIPVLDLATNEVRANSILNPVYYNTIAQVLHPEQIEDLIMLDAGNNRSSELTTKLLDNMPDTVKLDGATGSRKHGMFVGTRGFSFSETYFDRVELSRRISHYSILFTVCREVHSLQSVRLVVVDDEKFDNQLLYGVNDCHGLCSFRFARQVSDLMTNNVTQFRLGYRNHWIAKGTLLASASELTWETKSGQVEEVDLILPLSAFKGNKPRVNSIYRVDLAFGIVNVSRPSAYKVNFTALNWFKSDRSREYLVQETHKNIERLFSLRQDLAALGSDYIETNCDEEEYRDQPLNEQWLNTIPYLIQHDKLGVLSQHPAVAQWAAQYFKRRLLDAATGGLSATGLMAAPLPVLSFPDFDFGQFTVISYDLKPGYYMSFRYPIRNYMDVFPVVVINPSIPCKRYELIREQWEAYRTAHTLYQSYKGVAWCSSAVMERCAGDYDGDVMVFRKLDGLADPLLCEMQEWPQLPLVAKPAKCAINGSFHEIAGQAVDNRIGIVANLMQQACIFNLTHWYEPLAEQMQIEVDRFKSGLKMDEKVLADAGKEIDRCLQDHGLNANNYWFVNRKSDSIFLTRTITNATPVETDTIGIIFNLVTEAWEHDHSPFRQVETSSFKDLHDDQYHPLYDSKADELFSYYAEQAQVLLAAQELVDMTDKNLVRLFSDKWQELRLTCMEMFLAIEDGGAMAAALHRRMHFASAQYPYRTAMLSWFLGFEQHVKALQSVRVNFRLWKHDSFPTSFSGMIWDNQEVEAFVQYIEYEGQSIPLLCGETDDNEIVVFGRIIVDKAKIIMPGLDTFRVKLKSHFNRQGILSYVAVTA